MDVGRTVPRGHGPVRVIRLRERRTTRRAALGMAIGMLVVGAVAATLALAAPARQPGASALLAILAALALGVGAGWLVQVLRSRSTVAPEDLVRLLSGALDDAYLLLVDPRLPGVPADVEALLVGPPGVRAVIARRWHGRYRVRGHGWEFDARGRRGWIPCITNPTFEGAAARSAVAAWARGAGQENLPIEAAIAFPSRHSLLVLEEPDAEVITSENAPWWANGMGRVQRLNAQRVVAFAEAVMEASRAAEQRGNGPISAGPATPLTGRGG